MEPECDWIYDDELEVHLPVCSQQRADGSSCGNGPLTGEQVTTGDCGEDHGGS